MFTIRKVAARALAICTFAVMAISSQPAAASTYEYYPNADGGGIVIQTDDDGTQTWMWYDSGGHWGYISWPGVF